MSGRLAVRLTPGAIADRIEGWEVDAEGRPFLKLRVRARPVEGAANAALVALVARRLGVARSAVDLARGGQSRMKLLTVAGLSDIDIRERLSAD